MIAYAVAGASAALAGIAIYRWIRGGNANTTEIAVAPSAGGPTLWVSSHW